MAATRGNSLDDPGAKRCLDDFDRLQKTARSDHELFDQMTEMWPDSVANQSWLMFGFPGGISHVNRGSRVLATLRGARPALRDAPTKISRIIVYAQAAALRKILVRELIHRTVQRALLERDMNSTRRSIVYTHC